MKILDSVVQGLNPRCNVKSMAQSSNYFKYMITRRLSISKNLDSKGDIFPVLIVGAGPVGLVLSILLTKLGVRCAVVEKNRVFSKHPQAHFINNRSMEVFRKLDGLSEDILRSQPPVDLWRKFIYCTSLSGTILGSVDHIQPQDLEQVVSPVTVAHLSQYKLVNLLLKKLEKLDFQTRTIESDGDTQCIRVGEILMGHECVSIEATNHYLNVTALVQNGKKFIERNIKCGFLIGTDGAGSTVRKLTGIAMRGEQNLQNLVSVHFLSRGLGKYLLKERPGMLFFIFNTTAIGVLVAHDLEQGEFVLQVPIYPPQQKLEDFNREMCEMLVCKLVGRELGDINVVDIKPWVMHAEVAERFMSSDDRIILAGDAAHRFPPAGGFGMNTGIQDAHNLAWKLASVISGLAPTKLLKTYETERRLIAVYNTELSVQNFRAAMSVPSALGLDPSIANSVHQVINDGVASILPSGLQRVLLDGAFTIGRAQLSETILNERNPLGSSRFRKLRRIFEEGKSLQLQFPAEDLGFRYLRGALLQDNHSMHGAPEPPTGRRRDYVPSAEPGSRLPHMKVRRAKTQGTISTLDLVSGDKLEFVLIIAPFKESYDLAHAALKVAEKFKISIKVCTIWPADGNEPGSSTALLPRESCIDVVEVKSLPSASSWWNKCQMSEKGAILVRPDEHIAWRARSEVVENPITLMERAISAVLGV